MSGRIGPFCVGDLVTIEIRRGSGPDSWNANASHDGRTIVCTGTLDDVVNRAHALMLKAVRCGAWATMSIEGE